jgi:hypothetical protein
LLFQQNFVIGKDTNSYFMVSNSPQTYTGSGQAATVTILQVQYQEQFPIFLPEEQQLKLMQEPITANFVPTDCANYNSLLLFQQNL